MCSSDLRQSREVEQIPKITSQFGLQSATRLHEAGIASNRESECRGEYVPGSVMSVDTSSKRDTNPSSFSNSVLFSAIYELTELAFNNQFLLVAFFYTADNLCVDIE